MGGRFPQRQRDCYCTIKELWQLIDAPLSGLNDNHFTRSCRCCGGHSPFFQPGTPPVRANAPKQGESVSRSKEETSGIWDEQRAALMLPLLRRILALPPHERENHVGNEMERLRWRKRRSWRRCRQCLVTWRWMPESPRLMPRWRRCIKRVNMDYAAASGGSSPKVALAGCDIRQYFPSSVVQVMQKTPLNVLVCTVCCWSRRCWQNVQPDVHLVSTLMSLNGVIPVKPKKTAEFVVRKVVEQLMKQLEEPMRSAVSGALNRAVRNRRPRHAEIDWQRTIRANLRHWQEEYKKHCS